MQGNAESAAGQHTVNSQLSKGTLAVSPTYARNCWLQFGGYIFDVGYALYECATVGQLFSSIVITNRYWIYSEKIPCHCIKTIRTESSGREGDIGRICMLRNWTKSKEETNIKEQRPPCSSDVQQPPYCCAQTLLSQRDSIRETDNSTTSPPKPKPRCLTTPL